MNQATETELTNARTIHNYRMRMLLHDKAFIIKNKATRMGIVKYIETQPLTFMRHIDYAKLAILLKHDEQHAYNIDEPIDEQHDHIIQEDEDEPIYELIDRGDGDIYTYKTYEEAQDEVYNHLREWYIMNCDMTFLRKHMKDEIKTYQYKDFEEEDQEVEDAYECDKCPICLEEWSEQIEQKPLRCLHSICVGCYDNLQKEECPLCREPLHKLITITQERSDDELRNYMEQETADTICDEWFNDFYALIDEMLEADGLAHILGCEEDITIDFYNPEYKNLRKLLNMDVRHFGMCVIKLLLRDY